MARWTRFLKFQGVGAIGILVQLAALALYFRVFSLPLWLATGLAVETAVLHNFIWHERWTWRRAHARAGVEIAHLLWKFHLGAGGVSLATNMLLTPLLSGWLRIHYLVANIIAIACAGVLNFLVSEFLVFRPGSRHVDGRQYPKS